ncbi:14518_t:CDS:10 [Ambispora leptoticha]|uniref:Protein transport protein SEC31 n=1 Tax=Ambispora leptoticha TaxID=144679 RepID=A0A9N9G4Z5_9GLOM|nr:14518_t:CDS:10 [Ambispora leptoticha]
MKLKEIPRTATFAWSPGQHLPIIASGTVAGALDASFSNTTELELFHLDLHNSDASNELKPAGVVTSNTRFDRLAWGNASDKAYGIIAGGMENGELDLWDPAVILEGGDAEKALLLRNKQHSGNVRGLQFNPFQNNVLGSAATNGEIFIWDLTNPEKPYGPGTRSPKLEEITYLAWNNQVQHILATSSTTGYTVIWDLKNKREVMHLSYSGPTANIGTPYGMGTLNVAGALGGGGRRGTTSVAWNPDVATQLITASEDDNNPVIVMWDLRNAHAPEKVLTGHTKGVLALSWCRKDADLLLSSGKDNRTLCWNPRTSEKMGELPPSLNWTFDVQWCPGNPDLLATASFDGKISVHSLQSAQDPQPSIPQSDDPFAPITSSYHQPSLSLKQPPKWLRRPVGAIFGFGGKIVFFTNKPIVGISGTTYRVITSTPITEPEVVKKSVELEASIEAKALSHFCENRGKEARNDLESENWKVLQTLFNEDAREQLVQHLGFSKTEVVTQITEAIKSMKLDATPKTENESTVSEPSSLTDTGKVVISSSSADETSESQNITSKKDDGLDALFADAPNSGGLSDASDLFNSNTTTDAFPVTATLPTSTEEKTLTAFNLGTFKIYPTDESEYDKLITRSIILGDFESAVNLCLQANRLSEALVLAGFGGPELLQRTQNIYFERCVSTVPYLRLLQSIVSGDLSDIVYNADLSEWQEVVVVLCTFARGEEFAGLCNALGQRLEDQHRKLELDAETEEAKTQSLHYRRSAVLCYLASGNLENVVNIWIAEQEEEEYVERKKAEQEDKAHLTESPYSYHAKTLQNLIEKVTVFRKAIDYVDPALIPNLESVESTESNNKSFKLAKLYQKYAEYAEILATQGRLSTALKYISLIPLEYQNNDIQDSLSVIRERIYNSGVDVGNTKPPAFPFEQVFVGADGEFNPFSASNEVNQYQQTAINNNIVQAYNPQQQQIPAGQTNYYNQQQTYPYNVQQQVANPGGVYQQQPPPALQQQISPNQQPIGYNNRFAQAGYNVSAPYQPAYPTGYPQQYPINNNTTNQFIPSPFPPVAAQATPYQVNANANANAAANPTNDTPPDIPAAYKKNLPNWNDPPIVSNALANKRTAQAQSNNKPQPITSPFPTSTSPAPAPLANPNFMQPPLVPAAPQHYPTRGGPPPGAPYQPIPPPTSPKNVPAANYYAQNQAAARNSSSPQTRPSQDYYGPGRSTPTPPPNQAYAANNPANLGFPTATNVPQIQNAPQIQNTTQTASPVQQAKSPAPEKTPTPVNKHPTGDRTHIPPAQKPIYEILSNELLRAQQNSPPNQKKVLDDTAKRLNALFDELNNELVQPAVIESLSILVKALQVRDYGTASKIQVDLITRYDECQKWLIGLKRLIEILKGLP